MPSPSGKATSNHSQLGKRGINTLQATSEPATKKRKLQNNNHNHNQKDNHNVSHSKIKSAYHDESKKLRFPFFSFIIYNV